MSYRDEREALRLRMEQLEGELSARDQTIARLQGKRAEKLADGERDWVTGYSRHTHIERKLESELNDDAYEAIAEMLQTRLPNGRASQVGQTLIYRWGAYELRLSRPDAGGVLVRVNGNHPGRLPLALGSAGLSAITAPVLSALALTVGASSIAVGLTVVMAIAGTFMGLRALTAGGIVKQRGQIHGIIEAIADLAAEHAAPERARILTRDGITVVVPKQQTDRRPRERSAPAAEVQAEREALAEAEFDDLTMEEREAALEAEEAKLG